MFIRGLIRGWLVGRGVRNKFTSSPWRAFIDVTDEQRQAALRGKYNFDHPGKLNFVEVFWS